jgi:hypothetical protein
MSRLKLQLHLDDTGTVIGGGWSFYHPSDSLVSSEAIPGFSGALNMYDGAAQLIQLFLQSGGLQLEF